LSSAVFDSLHAAAREHGAIKARIFNVPRRSGAFVAVLDEQPAPGATMTAAVEALRQLKPARIVVAVPTASPETCEEMRAKVDDVVCAITPEPFHAVGLWYQDFTQITADEVRNLLAGRDAPEQTKLTESPADRTLVEALRVTASPLTGASQDHDPLMDRIGGARFVLLGEASHGTYEFYHDEQGSRSG
jgi:hypothetical protein